MDEAKVSASKGPLIVFLASLLWATDGPFRKPLLVGGLSAGFISFLEHAFNSLACLPGLISVRGQLKDVTIRQWAALFYIGAGASALGALLFVQGAVAMEYNFTVAALLQKLQPVFAIILAVVFLREKLPIGFWLLVPPALIGAYLVSFGWASPQALLSAGAVNLKGSALAILAALLWAGGTVVGRSLMTSLNLSLVNGMRFLFGLAFLGLYVSVAGGFEFGLMTGMFWRNVIIIALLTGFFALLLYYYGLKNTKASLATLMELGYPLALTAVNWKFLGIALSPGQILGALVLLISVTALVLKGNSRSQALNLQTN